MVATAKNIDLNVLEVFVNSAEEFCEILKTESLGPDEHANFHEEFKKQLAKAVTTGKELLRLQNREEA